MGMQKPIPTTNPVIQYRGHLKEDQKFITDDGSFRKIVRITEDFIYYQSHKRVLPYRCNKNSFKRWLFSNKALLVFHR